MDRLHEQEQYRRVNLNCSERPNVSRHAAPHATRNVLQAGVPNALIVANNKSAIAAVN